MNQTSEPSEDRVTKEDRLLTSGQGLDAGGNRATVRARRFVAFKGNAIMQDLLIRNPVNVFLGNPSMETLVVTKSRTTLEPDTEVEQDPEA